MGIKSPVATPPIVLREQRQEFPVHPVSSGDSPHSTGLTAATWSTTTQPMKLHTRRADSNGDSNSSSQRQAPAVGSTQRDGSHSVATWDMSGLKTDGRAAAPLHRAPCLRITSVPPRCPRIAITSQRPLGWLPSKGLGIRSSTVKRRLCRILMKNSGYPIMSRLAELSPDELIQPLGIWLNPTCLFLFVPSVPVGRITHHDHPDTVRAPYVAGLFDRQLDRFILFTLAVWDVEDHIGMRGASQMRKGFVDDLHIDRIEWLDLEGHDLHVLAGQVAVGPDRDADKIRPRPPAACLPPALSSGYLNGERFDRLRVGRSPRCQAATRTPARTRRSPRWLTLIDWRIVSITSAGSLSFGM